MRTLKKGLSSLLVLSLLLGGGLLFAPKADAYQGILFPFITTETGKFTFITITNDGFGTTTFGSSLPGFGPTNQLHFTYAHKGVPIVNKAGCSHFDGDAGTTDNDMMIFEVNRKVTGPGGTTVLFEPGAFAPITSTPLALPVADRVGFLIVETNAASGAVATPAFPSDRPGATFPLAPVPPGAPSLFGTAAVIDSANGLTFSYSTNFSTSYISPNPDFTAIDGGLYLGPANSTATGPGTNSVGSYGFKNATWYPTSVVGTSWFILPLSRRSVMAPAGGGGIRVALRTTTNTSGTVNGAYDLDERFFSGGAGVPVRCFGLATRSDFLGGASSGADVSTIGGGFTWVATNGAGQTLALTDTVDPGGAYHASPFSMFKSQTTTALGAVKSAIHQEPDHEPCFNPGGQIFGLPKISPYCAIY